LDEAFYPGKNTCFTGHVASWTEGRDLHYESAVEVASPYCPPEEMGAEDPLFILYTSGSTGKPKGVVHTAGGYMVYAALTHKTIFDYQAPEVYWCAADVGWITGHSYIVYGPLANGATTLMFEGVRPIRTLPDFGRLSINIGSRSSIWRQPRFGC
jgi:acetyl-CoA synthetase